MNMQYIIHFCKNGKEHSKFIKGKHFLIKSYLSGIFKMLFLYVEHWTHPILGTTNNNVVGCQQHWLTLVASVLN